MEKRTLGNHEGLPSMLYYRQLCNKVVCQSNHLPYKLPVHSIAGKGYAPHLSVS